MAIDIAQLKNKFAAASVNQTPSDSRYRCASVFMLLFELGNPHLLAILKSDSEGYPWRNQVAFPGGHADENDDGPLATAFRELEEELGIPPSQVEAIGTTGHFQTINHVDIQAFVGVWNGKGPIHFDTNEIARVLKMPFKDLFQTHITSNFHGSDPDMTTVIYPYRDVEIWGASARILHHFIELMYPLFELEFKNAG